MRFSIWMFTPIKHVYLYKSIAHIMFTYSRPRARARRHRLSASAFDRRNLEKACQGDLAPVREEGGGGGACSKLFVLADVHRPKYAWVCGPGSSRLLPNWLLFHDACGSSCYSGRVTGSINLNCHHLQPLWWKLFHPLIKGTPVKHYQRLWGQHCWRFCQRAAGLTVPGLGFLNAALPRIFSIISVVFV